MKKNLIVARKRFADYQNNTNISLVNRYVYFAIDKVANSTIKQCLFEIEYQPVGKRPVTLFDKRCSPLLSPYQLPDTLLQDALTGNDFFRFAFVRDPYSRLLSCYLDRILTKTSNPRRDLNKSLKANNLPTDDVDFETFIETICNQSSPQQNSHWRVQHDDLCFDLIEFDYIAKFEKLWDEMEVLSKRIFGRVHPEMKDRGINKSPKATGANQRLKEYYTQKTADMVFDRYRQDFDSFGYSRMVDF